jgi:hypothetical protein
MGIIELSVPPNGRSSESETLKSGRPDSFWAFARSGERQKLARYCGKVRPCDAYIQHSLAVGPAQACS